MRTNGPTGGNRQEPGRGLIDIPKLDPQRKEQIRSGILTGIRSWKKSAEDPVQPQPRGIRRRRVLLGGGLGLAGLAAALSFLLLQTTGDPSSGLNVASRTESAIGEGGSGETPASGAAGNEAVPQGLAPPLLSLSYGEFRERWEQGSSTAGSELTAVSGEAEAYPDSLPHLDEHRQAFGRPEKGYRYAAWSNRDDGRLREITFWLGPSTSGRNPDPSDTAVIRYVTDVLQPDLTDTERERILNELRFRDFERKGGSRISGNEELLYTLDRSGERQYLTVTFLREPEQPDELGIWQDKLLDILREENGT